MELYRKFIESIRAGNTSDELKEEIKSSKLTIDERLNLLQVFYKQRNSNEKP